MTAAVGGASPSAMEGLLQAGAVKAGASGHKSHVRQSENSQSESGEGTEQPSEARTSSLHTPVNRSEKTSGHKKHSKSQSDDDSDASFESTFDSIDQGVPKRHANSEQHQTFSPALAIAEMAAQTKSGVDTSSPEAVQGAVRPAGLLKQNSIVALMDAKSRLLIDGDNKQGEAETIKGAMPNLEQEQAPDAIPLAVNGRETHWNFDDKTLVATAQQISVLRNEGQIAPRTPLTSKSATTAPSSAPATASKSGEPTTKPTDGLASQVQPQAISAPEADTGGNPSFGTGDQPGSNLNGQAATDPAQHKIEKADPSDPVDQLVSTSPGSSQGAAPAVVTQVRNGVIDTLAKSAAEVTSSPVAAGPDLPSRSTAPPPVLRTLDLTLSPPDLGSVRLQLSLKSNSLAIDAEASKSSTAKMLNDDRAALERGLKDAGYDLSSLKITDASASSSTSSNNNWQTNGSPFRDGDQTRSSFSGRQDGDMQRREGSMPDQPQRRAKDSEQQNSRAEPAGSRQANALYI